MQIEEGLFVLPTDKAAEDEGCYVDLTLPSKVKKFCSTYCIQSKAPFDGQPLKLMPWQIALINTLYGWRRADGSLRFRRSLIWLPKKQGKSTLLAALSLFHLLLVQGSEVYCLAATRDQAAIVYNQSCDFVENSPALSKRLWLRQHIRQIEDRKKKSLLKILSSDATGKSGFSSTFLCCDELAEWPRHSSREVWDKVQDAGAAREDSLLVTISTAQFDKDSVGYEQYRRAKRILDGSDADITTLPIVYEVEEHTNWQDSSKWWPALPSVDVTVPRAYYLDALKAIENNPLEETRFRTLLLNQWVGSPLQWLPSNLWASCISKEPENTLHGLPAVIGIDYARRYDLCAYAVVIEQGELFHVLPRFFIPRDVAREKELQDNVPYQRWAADPKTNLYLTPGNVVDPSYMRERIHADSKLFQLREVRYDPYGMEESRQILEQSGYMTCEVKQTPQAMSPGFSKIETLVRDGKLRHPDNAVLNWNIGNSRPRTDKNDRLMIEKASNTQRIDGVDALAIALTYWLVENNQLPAGMQWGMTW